VIKVNVWLGGPLKNIVKGEGDAAWGHASMEVFDGLPSGRVYISWWPMSEVYYDLRSDPETSHLVVGVNQENLGVYAGVPYNPRSLKEDIALEGGKQPLQVVLKGGLDETAIKAWWRRRLANKNALYMASKGNCSTAVYMALIAGGSYEFTPWHFLDRPWFSDTPPDPESANYPLVMPSNVLEYARVIEKELEAGGWDKGKKYSIVDKIEDASVRRTVKDALDDNGKLSLREVKLICSSATDKGGVTKQEVRDLKRLYRLSKTMDNESKQFLKQFIKRYD
jgi:hypothetical protein